MNTEEAKVPNVDGDWQSIEIFLFSNGQQYSPPRKYFITADELVLWDDTLSQLALSQYGFQCPLDLYTTDGQLVEGPLELKNGQAYVAVAPPDAFVDAGYDRYLLKATRSWEKRHARKKIPECIPGESCCLCPEKDLCFDLQMCCLCPEREEADVVDPLLCATDYPGLRPAGGHFMSSAPPKPDGYKTKSSNIGPGEYSLFQGKPFERQCENVPRFSKNGVKPGKYEPNSGKNGVLPNADDRTNQELNFNKKEADEIELLENEKSLSVSKDKPHRNTVDTVAGNKCHHSGKFQKPSSILSLIGESEPEKKVEDGVKDSTCSINGGEQNGRENNLGNGPGAPRPRKNENVFRLSDEKAAGSEHKRRLDELKRGEIEHTRRANDQSTPGNESRTTEPTREFELGGRSERKSEQRNKQGDHVARLSGRKNRVYNHDTGLKNSSSGPGAKVAASRYKASSRDIVVPRTKNVGQLKSESFAKVDEGAASLNGADINDRKTGAEVQQQGQRNSLSTGRPSSEKKRLLSGQNPSLIRKPTSSVPHKLEDGKAIKTKKEILPKKTSGNSSAIPVSAVSEKSEKLAKNSNKRITRPVLPTRTRSLTKLITKQESLATDNGCPENIIDVKRLTDTTHIFTYQESEIRSSKFDSFKEVDVIKNASEETQTEPDFEKSMPPCVDKGIQTYTENQRDYKISTINPEENIISILNKGEIINLKLNIEVRSIVRSDSQKNSTKSQSLTNIVRSNKGSQISIDDDMLQSVVNDQHSQGYGFESSPKVMIVQCAGCGPLSNPPRRDTPPSFFNEQNYFVLLTNSMHENHTSDSSNYNPMCRPHDQTQSHSKKPCSSGFPLKSILSNMALETMTTVTLSGVQLKKQEIENCITTSTSSRTDEPQSECVMTNQKVSIPKNSGTKCCFQKQSVSSLSVTTYIDNLPSCLKACKCEELQVCSESCQKVQSVCTSAKLQICPQEQSKGCEPTCTQVQTQGCTSLPSCCPIPTAILVCSQGCSSKSPTCPPCCPKPPPICPPCCPPASLQCCPKPPAVPVPCIQIQTLCPQSVPQVTDAQTQTQWSRITLQARRNIDGRYSFYLPPLNVINNYQF